jgi:4-azaleucine resistance transporter AzlC
MERIRDGIVAALPLGAAVLFEGVAFGVLGRGTGLSAPVVVAASALVFSGSAQFGALAVIGGGGSIAAAGVAAGLVNLRSLPLTLSVTPQLRGSRLRRGAEAQLVSDETWALSQTEPGRFSRRLLIGAALVMWLTWVAGTLVGALGAGAVPTPEALGLDAGIPAVFLALLAPQLRGPAARRSALGGAAVALALVPLLPAGVPLAAAALVPLVVAAR